MKMLPYTDREIGRREMVIITANVVIGVGILTFPRGLAKATGSVDGWISVLLTGVVFALLGWGLGTLASRFPKQTFPEYAAAIVTRPVAVLLVLFMGVYYTLFVAFEVRAVGNIAKQYLFTTTPVEVITLCFLLIVQYAVFGLRTALLRLNMIFLPIVLLVITIVQLYTLPFFEIDNVKPFFVTDVPSILEGVQVVVLSFTGLEIILFYGYLLRQPSQAPKDVLLGLSVPIALYISIYVIVIGVFTADVAMNLTYPTIELAKEVEVPGGFMERVESIFFTIWIMTIFNTCSIFFDLAVFMFQSIFSRLSKVAWLLILSPVIYIVALYPENLVGFFHLGDQLTYAGLVLVYFIPLLLLLIAKLRGVKGDG